MYVIFPLPFKAFIQNITDIYKKAKKMHKEPKVIKSRNKYCTVFIHLILMDCEVNWHILNIVTFENNLD